MYYVREKARAVWIMHYQARQPQVPYSGTVYCTYNATGPLGLLFCMYYVGAVALRGSMWGEIHTYSSIRQHRTDRLHGKRGSCADGLVFQYPSSQYGGVLCSTLVLIVPLEDPELFYCT